MFTTHMIWIQWECSSRQWNAGRYGEIKIGMWGDVGMREEMWRHVERSTCEERLTCEYDLRLWYT